MKAIKGISLLLAAVMTVGLTAGCAKGKGSSSEMGESAVVSSGDREESSLGLTDPTGGDDASQAEDSSNTEDTSSDGSNNSGSGSNNSGSSGNNSNNSGSSGNNNSSGTQQTAKLEGNVYVSGYPIVKEKVTLKVMAVKGYHSDYDDMRFSSVMEEKTNVKVQWMMVPEGQQVEKKELALRSGNLPHIMTLFGDIVTPSDVNRYSSEGVFLDISGKLAKWAPNAKSWIDKNPYTKAAVTMPEGQIYSLPLIRDEGPSNHYWFINKKWLNNLGLQIPKTTAELYNVMKRFKTGNPDGDNIRNQIPFAMWCWHPSIFSPWGVPLTFGSNGMILNKNDEVVYGFQTPNFKAAVEFWAKAYKEDLIGKKALNTDYTEYQKILAGGKVGIFIWSWPVTALGEELAKDYAVLPIPDSKYAGNLQTGVALYGAGIGKNTIFFTKQCNSGDKGSADLATALRWYDYFYTTEGALMKQYADPGYKYYDYSNGVYTLRDNTSADTSKDAPGYGLPGLEVSMTSLGVKESAALSSAAKLSKEFETAAKTAYGKQKVYGLPAMQFTASEIKQINKYQPYFGDDLSKAQGFMEGTRSMSEYDSVYLKDMTLKGVDKYIAPYRSAYNRVKKQLK